MSSINDNNSIEKQISLVHKTIYKEKVFVNRIGRKIFLVGIASLIITQLPLLAVACAGPINQIPFVENRVNKAKSFCDVVNMVHKNLLTKESGILIGTAVASSIVSALITRMLLLDWSDSIMNDQQRTIEDLSIELFHCYQQSKK